MSRFPRHHPPEDRLTAYAAGATGEAEGVLIATHLALCPQCRARVAEYEALGGALLEDLPAESLADGSLAQTLARLEAPPKSPPPVAPASAAGADLVLPQPLRGYVGGDAAHLDWQRVGPSLRIHPLSFPAAKLLLMRVPPGKPIPHHGHRGQEMVLTLAGGYHDGPTAYLRGDVQASGPDIRHRPVADADGECLCLVLIEGRLRIANPLGQLLARMLGF